MLVPEVQPSLFDEALSQSRYGAGECCGCQRAPIRRLRFNLIVEDAGRRRAHSQLLCGRCIRELLTRVIGHSVERTPQAELDVLPSPYSDAGWPEE